MKRQTRRKLEHNAQSGSGGERQLTQVDEAMMDILGRETVNEKGLDEPDDSPVIGGQQLSVQHDKQQGVVTIAGKITPRTFVPAFLAEQGELATLHSILVSQLMSLQSTLKFFFDLIRTRCKASMFHKPAEILSFEMS